MEKGDKVRVVIEGEVSRVIASQAIHIKGYGKVPIHAESSFGAKVDVQSISPTKK